MINEKPMQLAKRMSYLGIGRVRIGAVLVNGKNVFSGFNKSNKTHPLCSTNSYRRLHAEISCCVGRDRSTLEGGTMYVYREDREGRIAISKPCPNCQEYLRVVGIKRCYYTDPRIIGNVGMINL